MSSPPFTPLEAFTAISTCFDIRYWIYAESASGFDNPGDTPLITLMHSLEMPILASAQYVEKNTECESLKLAAKTIQTLPAKAMCTIATVVAMGEVPSLEILLGSTITSFTLLLAPGMLALAKGCANYAENEALAEKIENASEIYMNAIKVLNIAIGIIALTAPIYFGTATLSLTTVIAVISVGSMIYNALETNNLLPTFETSQEAIA